MKRKHYFLGFAILLMIAIFAMAGCELDTGDQTFPSGFQGITWKRSSYSSTLTFTKNTLKASNLNYSFTLQSVSGDVYTIKSSSSSSVYTPTIKLVNGNLQITGDTFTAGENNWNGTWTR
jgi:hypothetical protein